MPTQKIFNQILIFGNLYHHAKNRVISSNCFGDIVHLKNSNLIAREDFSLYPMSKVFAKDMCRYTTDKIKQHIFFIN